MLNDLVAFLRDDADWHDKSVSRTDPAVVKHVAQLRAWAEELEALLDKDIGTACFNVAEHLDSEELITEYLDAALECCPDSELLAEVRADVAKARERINPPPWPWPKSNPHIGGDFDEFLMENGMLKEAVDTAQKRVEKWKETFGGEHGREEVSWKETVIDACVINCMEWQDDNPYNTLRDLIRHEVTLATDPRVCAHPEKWRMVPTELTDEMIAVMNRTLKDVGVEASRLWIDVLAAAPLPPKRGVSDQQIADLIKSEGYVMYGYCPNPEELVHFAKKVLALKPE